MERFQGGEVAGVRDFHSSTMMVMMIARTPSLRLRAGCFHGAGAGCPKRRRLPREKLWRVDGVGRKGKIDK